MAGKTRSIAVWVVGIVLGLVAATAVVAGTVAAVAAIANHKSDPKDGGRPSVPTTVTHDESEYSIVTPAGWTRKDVTSNADARKALRYEYADGSYFIVNMDPLGSDFVYDTLWNYEVKGLKFEVASKHDCADTVDEPCGDDARFSGYIMWKTGTTPAKVGGHTFYFQFGNDKKGSVEDASIFERILESITVKA
jgi:hypothetical protein